MSCCAFSTKFEAKSVITTCLDILFHLYAFTYEMGSRGRPLFDLNEPPAEDDEENDGVFSFQPQKALPSLNTHAPDLFSTSSGSQRILNNHAFTHASSVSGFQPFIRPKGANVSEERVEQKRAGSQSAKFATSSNPGNGEEANAGPQLVSGPSDAHAVEREEGEWSDGEGSVDVYGSSSMQEQSVSGSGKAQPMSEQMDYHASSVAAETLSCNVKAFESTKDENNSHASVMLDPDGHDQRSNSSRNSEGNGKGDVGPIDGQEEPGLVSKSKEVKGVEASYAVKCANNPGKKHKLDQHKEAMLGKKRTRQTVFLNLEDVKQAGPMKTSTPRRQNFPAPITTRSVKEIRYVPPTAERIGEKQNHSMIKDQKQVDLSSNEGGGNPVEYNEPKSESNNDMNSGLLGRPRRLNSANDISAEVHPPTILRQSSWKPNPQLSGRKLSMINQSESKLGNKKHPPAKVQATMSSQYQDTSVERLIREVTNEKFWHHPGMKLFYLSVLLFAVLRGIARGFIEHGPFFVSLVIHVH